MRDASRTGTFSKRTSTQVAKQVYKYDTTLMSTRSTRKRAAGAEQSQGVLCCACACARVCAMESQTKHSHSLLSPLPPLETASSSSTPTPSDDTTAPPPTKKRNTEKKKVQTVLSAAAPSSSCSKPTGRWHMVGDFNSVHMYEPQSGVDGRSKIASLS